MEEKEVGNNVIVFNLKNKRSSSPAFFEFFCFAVFLFLGILFYFYFGWEVYLFCFLGRVSCLTL